MSSAEARGTHSAEFGKDPGSGHDRRTILSGFLFGSGISVSIIDLGIFHLVLQWHHFYDRSTHEVALIADGFFQAFGWFITGAGLFQLFDGVILHKVLRIHQVRYDVDLLVYDVIWIGTAIIALLVGLFMLWRTRPARTRGLIR